MRVSSAWRCEILHLDGRTLIKMFIGAWIECIFKGTVSAVLAECPRYGIPSGQKRATMCLGFPGLAYLVWVVVALFISILACCSSALALTSEEKATIAAYEKVAPSVVEYHDEDVRG